MILIVIEQRNGDGLFINTNGIGYLLGACQRLSAAKAGKGDTVIVSDPHRITWYFSDPSLACAVHFLNLKKSVNRQKKSPEMDKNRILILGVGNVLMSDEGAGVHAIRKLEEKYRFSDNVKLLDGGTLGMKLLHLIGCADHLIVADTAIRGLIPGTVSRLTINDIYPRTSLRNSMHQLSFAETLAQAEMMQILPETVIIAIEPFDIKMMNTICTAEVYTGINVMCSFILSEITAAGGKYWLQETDDFENQ